MCVNSLPKVVTSQWNGRKLQVRRLNYCTTKPDHQLYTSARDANRKQVILYIDTGAVSIWAASCTVKISVYPRIYFEASCPHFNGTGSVHIYIGMWDWASLFRQFNDANVYGTGSVKLGKLAMKYPWIYGHFLECAAADSSLIGIGVITDNALTETAAATVCTVTI